jgi:GntR family transcriptional repressor for pyruvate dehydrogenase complex
VDRPLGTASLPPIARGNLTDRVQHLLRERILSGEWPAGTKLPAIERLAADAGVSRTVAREAVKALSTQGLLQVVHGHGTVVAASTNRPVIEALRYGMRQNADLLGIVEVRLALEVEAAALAAERRTEEDLGALRGALDRMLAMHDPTGFVEADVAFHQAVIRATHNPVFIMVAESMASLLEETRLAIASDRSGRIAGPHRQPAAARTPHTPAEGAPKEDSHVGILRRIVARDGLGAAAAMRSHLSEVRDNLAVIVQRRTAKGERQR